MAYNLLLPRRSIPVPIARGFTLLELMVVSAVALTLAALALPSWRSLLERWTLRTEAQALVDDLRYARTQALARAQPVSLCLSSNASVCGSSSEGSSGWLVFVDPDADRQLGQGESVLRRHEAGSQRLLIRSNHARPVLTYQSTGLARAAAQTLTLGVSAQGGARRLICISLQGRPALQAQEVVSCS
jgi:type IV fimbrial biogenesis protein FimT